MEKQARILCEEYAQYIRAKIEKPADWKEEYGKYPPTNTTIKNWFIDIIRSKNDERKIKLIYDYFDLHGKSEKYIQDSLFQKSKSIENFLMRISTPLPHTLDFIAQLFNVEIKSIYQFASSKNLQIDESYFAKKGVLPEKKNNDETKIKYTDNQHPISLDTLDNAELYSVHYIRDDYKSEKGKLYILENWQSAHLIIYKQKEPIISYYGKIRMNNKHVSIVLNESENPPFVITLNLSATMRNNVLIGTYSSFSIDENLPVAGCILLKKLISERDFNRETETEIFAEVFKPRIKVNETAYLTINRLPFRKVQSVHNEFTGVYEVFDINRKEEMFNKHILEISSDFSARMKLVDKVEYTGYVQLKNEGEIIYVHLTNGISSIDINLNAYYHEQKTLYGYYTGISHRNLTMGGKLFLAKYEDDKYANINPEKVKIDDKDFKRFASFYSNLVPFFLGKVDGFDDYGFLYLLGTI